MTTSKPTDGMLDAKLGRMLAHWEKPAVRSVMLPGTQMTCDEAAAAIRAALTGTVEPVEAVAVKALEWKLRSSAFYDAWKANTVVGRYDVGIVTHGFMAIRRSVEDGQDEDTILAENVAEDEAKAAAQADYETRIRSALAPATLSNPEAPAVVDDAAVERACEAFTSTWADEEPFAKAHYRKNMTAALSAALVATPPAPTDSTRPDYDLRCEECGRAHILDTVIPSGIWNQIAEPHNVLCTVCIDKRLQAKGLTAEAEFYFVGDALVSKLYATPPPQTSAVDGDTIAAIMEDIWTMARCSSPTDRQFWADKFCAALNAQAAPTSAVDGEMVKVLTPKMAEAGRAKLVELGYDGVDFTDAQQVYLAMRDAAPISAVDGLTYARISEIVHECRDRQRSAGEGDQMLSRWISEALSKAQSVPASMGGATHRHKKRGTDYVLIGIGKMQAEDWCTVERETVTFCGDLRDIVDVGPSIDMREVAIYRSVDDGALWVRPREEFDDGRFESLAENPSLPSGGEKSS
ncbi:hypothetical protein NKH45_10795 [Mesorhizobium sp. M1156]|uniref:hypothetical protein n=1 Tax=Mesorhizobium sp. M1156 TaxID=2957064 RepID=UPI003338CAB6